MATETRIKLAFVNRRGTNNVFYSTLDEVPATVTLEARGLGLVYTLRTHFGGDEAEVIGRYKTLESATYAATGFFADDLNALNGVDVPRGY